MEWITNTWDCMIHMDMKQVQDLLQHYSNMGPLPGMLFPFLEALFPVLPLMVFIMANSAAYGLWYGFLLSWLGVSIGAMTVFWFVRLFGKRVGCYIQKKVTGIERIFELIETKGFTTIFILFCIPFLPSSLVLLTAGLSRIKFASFIIPALAGRTVLVIILAFIGNDWLKFIHQPWRIIVVLFTMWVLWYFAKKIEKRLSIPKQLAVTATSNSN